MDASPVLASSWPWPQASQTGFSPPPPAPGLSYLTPSNDFGAVGAVNSSAPPDVVDTASRLALGDDNWAALTRLLGPQSVLGSGQPHSGSDPKLDALVDALRSAAVDNASGLAQTPPSAPIAASYPPPPADPLGGSYKPDWRLPPRPSGDDLGSAGTDNSRGSSAPNIQTAASSSLEPTYTVQAGDTPWGVARTHYSDIYAGLGALTAANGLKLDPATGSPIIASGQVLALPDISGLPTGSLAQDDRVGRGLAAHNQQRLLAYYAARALNKATPETPGFIAVSSPQLPPSRVGASSGDPGVVQTIYGVVPRMTPAEEADLRRQQAAYLAEDHRLQDKYAWQWTPVVAPFLAPAIAEASLPGLVSLASRLPTLARAVGPLLAKALSADKDSEEADADAEAPPVAEQAPSTAPPRIDRSSFANERRAIWRSEAQNNANSYSEDNLARMRSGKPPIGSDGQPMELHHVDGTPDSELQKMTRADHRIGDNYKANHPWVGR